MQGLLIVGIQGRCQSDPTGLRGGVSDGIRSTEPLPGLLHEGGRRGGTADDYLFHTAFARLFLDNIPHFQASWPTMGLAVAQDALRAGCDDMGGTMMEENVVSQAGSVHSCVSEQQVRAAVEAAGFAPKKRDSRYRTLEPSGDAS